jgi:hypothetical protein
MPGVTRRPVSATPATDGVSTPSSAPGSSNAAAIEQLGMCDADTSWEASGNLIGTPPVRDRCDPPNTGIVEDAGVFAARRSAAQATLATQQTRAAGFLDGDGNVIDHRYWFAKVYSFVTEEEIRQADSRTFYYPSYVMQSVRYFDQLYADNCDAWDNGGRVEEHWRQAFEQAADSAGMTPEDVLGAVGGGAGGLTVGALAEVPAVGGLVAGLLIGDAIADMYTAVSNMVVSMQAHIRYDLPRAEAWVFSSDYAAMENAQLGNFQPDFMSMTAVFDRAAERMNPVIAEKTGVPTDMMPRTLQDLGMDWWFDADMGTERADTWQRAEGLVANGAGETNPYTDTGTTLSGDATQGDNMSALQDLSPDLRPTMEHSAEGFDDDEVRDLAEEQDLSARGTSDRVRMLRALISGATLDDDEATILTILDASRAAGDLVTVIDGAGAWELADSTHGGEWNAMTEMFRSYYYTRTSRATALTLILRCLDGSTSEWEEAMVADLLCLRSDGRALVADIGAHYGGGGFTEGLNKLEWQLTGAEEDRIAATFGESGTFW